jgi:urease gamma subunit
MDIAQLANLGGTGAAIVVIWWMWRSAQDERMKYFEAFKELEADIRNKFSAQLMENTNAMLEHSKIMQEVVKLLNRLQQ